MSRALVLEAGPIKPPESEVGEVVAFARALEAMRPKPQRKRTRLIGPDGQEITLPASLFDALLFVAHEMAQGNAVQLVPVHAELTTQQAADLLAVSRPHVIKLMESDRLPHQMVGTHRRIRFDDLMAYKQQRDQDRAAALERLTRSAEDLELEY